MIEARGLTKVFETPKKVVAVDHIDFQVKAGEIFGLLGPNGSGKTTTIKLVSTLLYPTEGELEVNGYSVRTQAAKVRENIGVVLGHYMIYRRLTGRGNLRFYGTIYNVPNLDVRIGELSEFFGLSEVLDSRVETYSMGMCHKLALARGLLHDPDVLMLDEPTIGLDPCVALRLREKIIELKGGGKTILLSTHNMIEAEHVCDRVGIIKDGRLVAVDTPNGLKKKFRGEYVLEVDYDEKDAETIRRLFKNVYGGRASTTIKDHDELNRILGELSGRDVTLNGINLKTPSMEDVFIHYTKD